MGVSNIEQMPLLILEMYAIIHELEQHFPGTHFIPGGHLLGNKALG